MNVQDRLTEWFLSVFDQAMDFITLGWWSRHQGDERIALYKKDGER